MKSGYSHLLSPDRQTIVPAALAFPTRTLVAGEILYQEAREASFLYLIERGIVKAVVPTAVGRERIADLLGPGDVLGVAALDGYHHPETIIAAQEATVIPIDPHYALKDQKLSGHILHNLASQLRRSREAIDNAELPVGARLARVLLQLGERFGQETGMGPGVSLPLQMTHEDLASLVGSSRVTVTRVMGELRQEGALAGSRGNYVAHPGRLRMASDQYVMQGL
jgi:CRP/FNR family transcriptional regulator